MDGPKEYKMARQLGDELDQDDTMEAPEAEFETPEQAEADEAKAKKTTVKAADLPKDQRVSLMFGLPAGLKAMLEAKADETDTTTAALVRDLVAKEFAYELPVTERGHRAKKYETDAEKEEARKAAGKGRRQIVRNLLERYAKGEIDLPDELAAVAESIGISRKVEGDETSEEAAAE